MGRFFALLCLIAGVGSFLAFRESALVVGLGGFVGCVAIAFVLCAIAEVTDAVKSLERRLTPQPPSKPGTHRSPGKRPLRHLRCQPSQHPLQEHQAHQRSHRGSPAKMEPGQHMNL